MDPHRAHPQRNCPASEDSFRSENCALAQAQHLTEGPLIAVNAQKQATASRQSGLGECGAVRRDITPKYSTLCRFLALQSIV